LEKGEDVPFELDASEESLKLMFEKLIQQQRDRTPTPPPSPPPPPKPHERKRRSVEDIYDIVRATIGEPEPSTLEARGNVLVQTHYVVLPPVRDRFETLHPADQATFNRIKASLMADRQRLTVEQRLEKHKRRVARRQTHFGEPCRVTLYR